jgi:hypothetical protein
MPKQCPPGVLCIENATIMMVIIIIGGGILFLNYKTKGEVREKIIIRENNNSMYMPNNNFYDNNEDVLLNPYSPPLRDDSYFPRFRRGGGGGGMPINIQTQSADTTYRQVGILTRLNGGEMILPLMGRPLFTNRDKWNFYTMNDKNNMVKLPITNKGRSCTNEYGCDNLYNGDSVYVEGYNDAFKVTVYDNQIMRYIPFM